MDIVPIPALEDNYMYVLIDRATQQCAVIDAVEPNKLINFANEASVRIAKILTTHHHWDHANGNSEMRHKVERRQNEQIPVYGGDDRIPSLTNLVNHNDEIELGSLKIKCLYTPCHTTGHICYYVESSDKDEAPAVFTGDTLFISGCGRFFEGTPEQMYNALVRILGILPKNTRVYCGHEYTVNNLKFALNVEPYNENIKTKLNSAIEMRELKRPTVPSTINDELSCNPFLRVHELTVQKHTKQTDAINCMRVLREEKDKWKPN